MSKLFGNLSKEGTEATEDRLGGGFKVFDTDAYAAVIKLAYAGESTGGAKSMNYEFELEDGSTYKETVWTTNKQGGNTYAKDGKKYLLPGYIVADEIALLTAELELTDLEFEEKVINLYDYDAKKEVPTKVQMATELLGKKIILGIQKVLEFKNKKEGDEYVATSDTRETNNIQKAFHYDLMVTVSEAQAGKKEPGFYTAWVEKNKGQTYDKTKGGAPKSATGAPGSGAPAGGAGGAPRKSLFSS